jgi:8-hydroxy-5-deazaflavin:NADPH oxidoreductase
VSGVRIGVLGGTGPAGRALAARLASVGYEVVIGSRSQERAQEITTTLLDKWPDRNLPLTGAANEGAADADLVVVATPWDGAAETALSVRGQLEGKVVISMANALARVSNEFQPLVPPRGSVAASVQAAVPECFVAGALHHVPAKPLGDLDNDVVSDVLICSDHEHATAAAAEVVSRIPGLRPLDAGHLSNAAAIEAFTAVLLQLNTRYKAKVAIRLTGIDDVV